jgi:hypothetical protein
MAAADRPKRPAKNAKGEYAKFAEALKKVLSVPHSTLKSHLEAEKLKKQSKRASRVLDVRN